MESKKKMLLVFTCFTQTSSIRDGECVIAHTHSCSAGRQSAAVDFIHIEPHARPCRLCALGYQLPPLQGGLPAGTGASIREAAVEWYVLRGAWDGLALRARKCPCNVCLGTLE